MQLSNNLPQENAHYMKKGIFAHILKLSGKLNCNKNGWAISSSKRVVP